MEVIYHRNPLTQFLKFYLVDLNESVAEGISSVLEFVFSVLEKLNFSNLLKKKITRVCCSAVPITTQTNVLL